MIAAAGHLREEAWAVIDVQEIGEVLDVLLELPPSAAYALIAFASALENIFPPVPSDTFVILGAVLTERGVLRPLPILASAWVANVTGAMCIYGLARHRGPTFFQEGWGRRLLRPRQFTRISQFYDRYGLWAIFFSRFLPILRVVIPTFSGFTGLGVMRTLIPVAVASLVWNATLLTVGIIAARNLGRVLEHLGEVNAWLLLVTAVIVAVIMSWWIVSRRASDQDAEETQAETKGGESGE